MAEYGLILISTKVDINLLNLLLDVISEKIERKY